MGRAKGTKEVPDARKSAILDMHAVGVKQKNILQHYSMPQSTVAHIMRKGRKTNKNERSEKRGRKSKLTARSSRSLLLHVRKNRFKPLRIIAAEFNIYRDNPGSISTIRRTLHKNGIRNYVVVTKPFFDT